MLSHPGAPSSSCHACGIRRQCRGRRGKSSQDGFPGGGGEVSGLALSGFPSPRSEAAFLCDPPSDTATLREGLYKTSASLRFAASVRHLGQDSQGLSSAPGELANLSCLCHHACPSPTNGSGTVTGPRGEPNLQDPHNRWMRSRASGAMTVVASTVQGS